MDGRRWASIDLPEPGGPQNRRLCPPAAATSNARRASSWPLIWAMSSDDAGAARMMGVGRSSVCVPRKWFAIWMMLPAATIRMSALAQAASDPQACGQMSPRPTALAAIAAGSTPLTGTMLPSNDSSPSTA